MRISVTFSRVCLYWMLLTQTACVMGLYTEFDWDNYSDAPTLTRVMPNLLADALIGTLALLALGVLLTLILGLKERSLGLNTTQALSGLIYTVAALIGGALIIQSMPELYCPPPGLPQFERVGTVIALDIMLLLATRRLSRGQPISLLTMSKPFFVFSLVLLLLAQIGLALSMWDTQAGRSNQVFHLASAGPALDQALSLIGYVYILLVGAGVLLAGAVFLHSKRIGAYLFATREVAWVALGIACLALLYTSAFILAQQAAGWPPSGRVGIVITLDVALALAIWRFISRYRDGERLALS